MNSRAELVVNSCVKYDDLRLEDYGYNSEQPQSQQASNSAKQTAPVMIPNRLENSTGAHERHLPGVTNLNLGPMRLRQHNMSIMLLFGKEDAQSDGFWWAADRAGYRCNVVRTEADARDCYRNKPHDVIIIDARSNQYFNAESVCRHLRTLKGSEYTVIVAVTKNIPSGREEPSILPLLNAGFSKRFMENSSISVCLNELQLLEKNEVCLQIKLRAAAALFAATEQSNDAIEITSEDFEVQYVNPTFEKMFGFTSSEIVGKDARDLSITERNHPDINDDMTLYLKNGKTWEGVLTSSRKSGDSVSHHCQVTPVLGQNGEIRHYVSIKTPLPDIGCSQSGDRCNGDISTSPVTSLCNRLRHESLARIPSLSIETPITKIISLISAAQENCSLGVAQILERVLEILRSTELYSPYFSPQVKDDQMTHDLVGGLMTTNVKKYSGPSESCCTRTASAAELSLSPTKEPSLLSQASSEIQNLLRGDADWTFDILELERVTQKKPLVHLGLRVFQRFGVMEFLHVSEHDMALWFHMIEENYHSSNSYHNSTHAADVMHATAYFLSRDKIEALFDKMDEAASLIAAVVHDLDHPGKTNSFLVNSHSPLAVLYNDLAVLESHHVSLAFRLTERDPRLNIFKNLDRDDYRTIRQQIIDMVLATEMTKHFEHLNKFVSGITQPQVLEDDTSTMGSGKTTPDSTCSHSHLSTPENKELIKRIMIKCADVSNPLRPVELCKEWAFRIAEEYFQQTDEEKEKNLPVVMPVFDRKTCNVPKSQTSFIDFFINDMFDAWDAFCDIPEPMRYLRENYAYWKQEGEKSKIQKDKEDTGQN